MNILGQGHNGHKRYSKENLLINIPLSLGNTQLHFHGVNFSGNLGDIVDFNHKPVFNKIEDLLKLGNIDL